MTHKDIRPTKARVVLSVGESVRIVRELQGLTQSELARRAKILRSPRSQPSKTIPSIWASNGLKSWRVFYGAIPPSWCFLAGT